MENRSFEVYSGDWRKSSVGKFDFVVGSEASLAHYGPPKITRQALAALAGPHFTGQALRAGAARRRRRSPCRRLPPAGVAVTPLPT